MILIFFKDFLKFVVNILEKSLCAVNFLVKLLLDLLKNQIPRNYYSKVLTMDLSAFVIVFCIYSQIKS